MPEGSFYGSAEMIKLMLFTLAVIVVGCGQSEANRITAENEREGLAHYNRSNANTKAYCELWGGYVDCHKMGCECRKKRD